MHTGLLNVLKSVFTNAHKKECEYVKQILHDHLMNAENTTNSSLVCFGFLKEEKKE